MKGRVPFGNPVQAITPPPDSTRGAARPARPAAGSAHRFYRQVLPSLPGPGLLSPAPGCGRPAVEGEMRGEHPAQMALVDDQQVVEALAPHRPDPPLGDRVRRRRPVRRAHDRDALAAEDRVERRGELGVPVADQGAGARPRRPGASSSAAGPAASPRRRSGWPCSRPDGPPCAELDEEEHVDGLEEQRLDGEEVAGEDRVAVPVEEGAPGAAWRRRPGAGARRAA